MTAPAGRRPRVLHLAAVDDSFRYVLGRQLCWLRDAGFEVHAACRPGRHAGHIRSALGIPLHPVRISRRMNPAADLLALWDLRRLFRRERFDIVHLHFPKATLLGAIAAAWAGVPVVVNTLRPVLQPHMTGLRRRLLVALDRFTARRCARLLAQNPDDIGRYVGLGICPEGKLRPLGNGIELERFDPARVAPDARAAVRREAGIPADALVVGMVGRLTAEKGYAEFFRAVGLMRAARPDVRFLVAGESMPGERGVLPADLPSRMGLAGCGAMLGMREDVERLYAAMDLLVFPSHREAFPRVLMEAAAMGLPLVASDVSGCRRCVRDGENGFLVPVGDAPGFARRALELAGSPELRARMGAASRRLALAEFDEREVFRRVAENYRELLAGWSGS
ncbi:MAG TPA: glycosyltransferase family 4 protein [Planctomycetota bacterium]|nr:glycosyltransferase family 4 protein [Planctomycetota bacterium]